MTKSSYDLAALLDILIPRQASNSFIASLTKSWSEISVAVLDPDTWKKSEAEMKPVDGAQDQIVRFRPPKSNVLSVRESDNYRLGRFVRLTGLLEPRRRHLLITLTLYLRMILKLEKAVNGRLSVR